MNGIHYIEEKPRKEFWLVSLLKAIGYVALYMVTMTVFDFLNGLRLLVIMNIEGWSEEQFEEALYSQSNTMMIIAAIVTIFILIAFHLHSKRSFPEIFHLKKISPSTAFFALATGVTLNFALNVVMSYLPTDTMEEYGESVNYDNVPIVIFVLSTMILAPLIEEIIFRNFALTALRRSMPAWLSVALISAIFGGMHGHWVQMVYAGSLGVLLGAVFCYSESIYVSVLIHFAFNSSNIFVMFVDYEKMSESQQMTFNAIYALICYFCVFAACGAIVGLFASMKNSREKEKKEEMLRLAAIRAAEADEFKEENLYGE